MQHNNHDEIVRSSQLLGIIEGTRNHHPNFTLFLGAGASRTSGVKTSGELVREWRIKYSDVAKEDTYYDSYIKKMPEEYSYLFDKLYNQPSQRREIIEEVIGDASPSWGYIYLVNLLKERVFNTVFTTNFDDLLNEACYLFSSDVRPLVCAHDSSIRNIRITTKRPKIIKLHGDFLYDDIKNTETELESLESNMRDKFRQYAAEYGMIVIGYAGNDRSVMDTIDMLLRDEKNFPHGIYWCVRKSADLSDRVRNLRRFPNFYVVEVGGFDEFCAETNSRLDLDLQPEMADPCQCLTGRLNTIIERVRIEKGGKSHPVIDKDIASLGETISKTLMGGEVPDGSAGTDANGVIVPKGDYRKPVPYDFLAQVALRSGETDKAYKFIASELSKNSTESAYSTAFKIMRSGWNEALADPIIEAAKRDLENSAHLRHDPDIAMNWALSLMHAKQYDRAANLLEHIQPRVEERRGKDNMAYWTINRTQIYKHQNEGIPAHYQKYLRSVLEDDAYDSTSRWGGSCGAR